MIPHSIHHILTIPTAYTEITITIHNLLTGYIEPIHFKNHYSRNFAKSLDTEKKRGASNSIAMATVVRKH